MITLTLSLTLQIAPCPEVKRDQLMEKRYEVSLAALQEKDDEKTLAMLRSMTREFTTEMHKIKPAYEQWYVSLSQEDKKELLRQLKNKRWLLLMQQIQADEDIQARFKQNLTLRIEYESLQFLCDKASELSSRQVQ